MNPSTIRTQFLEFFRERGHTIVPSAPVVPHGDATLLFTNAGMNQFKDVFLEQGSRSYNRAVDSQKVIRVSGKHNDLEEVGPSPSHHTFFEMLGNWSFGDYYKLEAIQWAWELLTKVWGLDPNRLYATVFEGDDQVGFDQESFDIWHDVVGLPKERISLHGKKDNFWEMGEVGPCGPCSELHFDFGPTFCRKQNEPGHRCAVNGDCGRVVELWNLVFIQYRRDESGKLSPLPRKHVDTGAGFERCLKALEGVTSNYETSVFAPLIAYLAHLSGVPYQRNASGNPHRVAADHIRMVSFAIADGVLPSAEGRGSVVRKVIHRASRYGRKIGLEQPYLYKLVEPLCAVMGDAYPELIQRHDHIVNVIRSEEESFSKVLSKGEELGGALLDKLDFTQASLRKIFQKAMSEAVQQEQVVAVLQQFDNSKDVEWNAFLQGVSSPVTGSQLISANQIIEGVRRNPSVSGSSTPLMDLGFRIPGEEAFKLHDTLGFPLDLTEVMARERGYTVDSEKFDSLMKIQKETARGDKKFAAADRVFYHYTPSKFVGYDINTLETTISGVAVYEKHDENDVLAKRQIEIILKDTPFYAESGGQVSDRGEINIGNYTAHVIDVRKQGDTIVHICEFDNEDFIADSLPKEFNRGQFVIAKVDSDRRIPTQYNHTATHLLHTALRTILGGHANQAGSLVAPDRMRFDFTHFEKITDQQIDQIERMVNDAIRADYEVRWYEKPIKEALNSGIVALFGEKYGDIVRIIHIGPDEQPYSREFCGGCHVTRTGQIGLFRIVSEGAVSTGVRRIEAITGGYAYNWTVEEHKQLEEIQDIIGSRGSNPVEKLQKTLTEKKALEKELEKLLGVWASAEATALLESSTLVHDVRIIAKLYEKTDVERLKMIGDAIRQKDQKVVALLVSAGDNGAGQLVCVVGDESIKSGKLKAGDLVGKAAKLAGGGGGGKPHMATAGTKSPEKLDEAVKGFEEIVREII